MSTEQNNILIDFSFDELNHKVNNHLNKDNNESASKKNNYLFTCSTPRQSNEQKNNDEDFQQYPNDENNTELEKPDVSCDLLRSSKIDLDVNNSDLAGVNNQLGNNDDNTDADLTTNSIYSNFTSNQNNNLMMNQKNSQLDYKSPINQLNALLKNIRANNSELEDYNENNNYEDDSLILPKYQNDLSISNSNNKLNSIMSDATPKLQNNKCSKANLINTNNSDLKSVLEKEVLKRQHCEKQIEELNKKLLQLDEQLTVVTALDRKKETFINKLDKNLTKVFYSFYFLCPADYLKFKKKFKIMNTWKEQENQMQMTMSKLKQDKHLALINESNCINVRKKNLILI